MKLTLVGIFAAILGAVLAASADGVGYAGVREISVDRGNRRLRHSHDWSAKGLAIGRDHSILALDPFSIRNTFGVVVLSDRTTGDVIFSAPSPALTLLWISDDERYLVGLSDIRLWNPIQVVVYDTVGRILAARAVECAASAVPGCGESVTNWVHWFDEKTPDLTLKREGDGFVLGFRSRSRSGTPTTLSIPGLRAKEEHP
jgi:hypothetical protein